MTEEQHDNHEHRNGDDDNDDSTECKIFVSRIPESFSEQSVERLLQEQLGEGAVLEVALAYPKVEEGEGAEDQQQQHRQQHSNLHHQQQPPDSDAGVRSKQQHRGFGFVKVDTAERAQQALALKTLRGGAKASSKRMHILYLRPVVPKEDKDKDGGGEAEPTSTEGGVVSGSGGGERSCYLWEANRCPYGDDCKFSHAGAGGCIDYSKIDANAPGTAKKKCFAFKKGKCKAGDDCPYSHDFVVATKSNKTKPTLESTSSTSTTDTSSSSTKNEKVCINWKTKGKCRKGDQCPYRHDEAVREAGQAKRAAAKKKSGTTTTKNGGDGTRGPEATAIASKVRQPLWVRAFGLNYDSTQEDIRTHFKECGPIMEVNFPTFEDSGRSKGYCGVRFQSPNAVEKAIDLNGKELHGRWLSVQAGKMYLRQWEEQVQAQEQAQAKSRKVPDGQTEELDQRDVKRRKGAESSDIA
jgi:RNA recognition motif-containing protein